MALLMEDQRDHPGSASALAGTAQYVFGSVGDAALNLFSGSELLPMFVLMAALAFAALCSMQGIDEQKRPCNRSTDMLLA